MGQKAYHYAGNSNWAVQYALSRKQGLVPQRPLTTVEAIGFPRWASDSYLFAFLEKDPTSWRENTEFPKVWNFLMRMMDYQGIIDIWEFTLEPADSCFVLDWTHMEREREALNRKNMYRGTPYDDSQEDNDRIEQATRQYIGSRVPLSEYAGDFSLPELIVGNPIAQSRIEMIDQIYI